MSQVERRGFKRYPLPDVRQYPSRKEPAPHQEDALVALRKWFTTPASAKGAILVLPTGGGKTFTATRFLTQGPLSQGHKVIWLAHTHHLLDQAFSSFGTDSENRYEVGHVAGQRQNLVLRTVSGTLGHGRVAEIECTDDVLIITLQTLARAIQAGLHAGLRGFLEDGAKQGLTVVFDECHHAPAPTFRKLIESLRGAVPQLQLLGLTATPTYTDVRKQGYLKKLFPQGIKYEVSAHQLMLAKVLARPILEEPATSIDPEFSDQDYSEWQGSYREIPEKVIAHLASHRVRNAFIADTYAHNREKYGQTIIFADRWYQCTALVELLRQRGVRADTIFSHQETNPGSVSGRVARTSDENETVLTKFRLGELDVLVNIRMLTEGTDVPNAKTVFLTRQTTSRILLTQMIGRALRGPKFGGTDEAYIVAFIDEWKQHINWARWDDLLNMDVDEAAFASKPRPLLELISSELVAHLARELDASGSVNIPFLTLIPIGWYIVNYDAAVRPKTSVSEVLDHPEDQQATLKNEAATDNIETVRQLIPVYSQDEAAYIRLFKELDKVNLDDFDDVELGEKAQQNVRGWVRAYFMESERLTLLQDDVQSIVRHRAINGQWPTLTRFEARDEYDLDALAQSLAFEQALSRVAEDQRLRQEYNDEEKLWQTLYRNYDQFKRQYDHGVNRLLYLQQHPEAVPVFGDSNGHFTPDEVPQEVKNTIRKRDRICLCCGRTTGLQVDHIRSRYAGGTHEPENLQLLCKVCNQYKGIREIDFRQHLSPLQSVNEVMANADLLFRRTAKPATDDFDTLLRRNVNIGLECQAIRNIRWVKDIKAKKTYCEIVLHVGNDPALLQPLLDRAFALWLRDNPNFETQYGSLRAVAGD